MKVTHFSKNDNDLKRGCVNILIVNYSCVIRVLSIIAVLLPCLIESDGRRVRKHTTQII